MPPPKVVVLQERWKVQPGAEGYQGRSQPGASFCGRREAKSSIPGTRRSRRQGAPVRHAASRTAGPGSKALGGGCTTRAARATRPPSSPSISPVPDTGAQGEGGAEGEWRLPLDSPFPVRSQTSGGGACLPQAAAASALGERGLRRVEGTRRVTETERGGRAPGPTPGSRRASTGRARVAERLTLSRGESRGGRRLCLGLRGARSLRVHSPRPGRAPLGWRTLVVRGAHHFGRPLAGGLGLSQGRTPRGAHPPRPLRDWPGAGSPSCARLLRLPAPPESPPSPGGKKKRLLTRRGLWCVGRGGIAKPRGGS